MALHNGVNRKSNSSGSFFGPGDIALGGSLILLLSPPSDLTIKLVLPFYRRVFSPCHPVLVHLFMDLQTSQVLSSPFVLSFTLHTGLSELNMPGSLGNFLFSEWALASNMTIHL